MSEGNKWVKGMKSPNPNGRPKKLPSEVLNDKELKETLRKVTPQAIMHLYSVLKSKSSTENAKLKAAVKILDTDIMLILEAERAKLKESKDKKETEENKQPSVVYSLTAVE